MSRLVALLGALALVVPLAGCTTDSAEPPPAGQETAAASPQEAKLDWVERSPAEGPALVFRARRFAVTERGWHAELEIENETGIAWELGANPVAVEQTFGLMLFATGELEEVERRGSDGDLPGLRAARTFEPELPARLGPGEVWRGAVTAGGALARGRYVRVVFGPFDAVGDPPEGMPGEFFWISDNAYRLRR